MSTTAITPTALLAATPALFGFIPRESVILIGTTDRTVSLSVRFDLDGGILTTGQLATALRDTATEELRLIVVTAESDPMHAHPVIADVTAQVRAIGFAVVAQIQVQTLAAPGALWVEHRTRTSGRTTDYRDSAVTAQVVLEGRTIAADRVDVESRLRRSTRQVTPSDPETVDAAATVQAIITSMRDLSTFTPALAADIAGVIAQGIHRRDALLRTVIYDAAAAAEVFTQAAALLAGRPRADVLTLAAIGLYYAGRGSEVNATIVAARTETDDVNGLLILIDQAILRGLHPERIKEALSDLTSEERASDMLGADYPPYDN